MAVSEAYLDLGGGVGQVAVTRRWPAAYNEVIMKTCPRCGAGPGELCTNPSNPTRQNRAKIPCLARITEPMWN